MGRTYGRLSRGDGPRLKDGSRKCLKPLYTAYACGWSLATTLMTCVVVFRAGDDDFGVMTTAEYDGDPEIVIHEFDPWA